MLTIFIEENQKRIKRLKINRVDDFTDEEATYKYHCSAFDYETGKVFTFDLQHKCSDGDCILVARALLILNKKKDQGSDMKAAIDALGN